MPQHQPFFPDPAFGWAFCAVLMGLTLAAAYTDTWRLVIPKRLTLTALALGVVFNLVRGAWLAKEGLRTWHFEPAGSSLGALDGLLFSVEGFAVGFGLFFVMWVLGSAGGGDVKLFAALGAWMGPLYPIYVLALTIIVVLLISVFRLSGSVVGRGMSATTKDYTLKEGKRAAPDEPRRPRKRLVSYSLPVAVATALVLLWVFRVDLQLAAPKNGAADKVQAHAR